MSIFTTEEIWNMTPSDTGSRNGSGTWISSVTVLRDVACHDPNFLKQILREVLIFHSAIPCQQMSLSTDLVKCECVLQLIKTIWNIEKSISTMPCDLPCLQTFVLRWSCAVACYLTIDRTHANTNRSCTFRGGNWAQLPKENIRCNQNAVTETL